MEGESRKHGWLMDSDIIESLGRRRRRTNWAGHVFDKEDEIYFEIKWQKCVASEEGVLGCRG